mmetsp:Transcript_39687/g.61902  ORF Transcript_39687/g.61902 Transcript_39687/m.61902 type:complete len:308 (+) Transcript_39687:93-1016(+)
MVFALPGVGAQCTGCSLPVAAAQALPCARLVVFLENLVACPLVVCEPTPTLLVCPANVGVAPTTRGTCPLLSRALPLCAGIACIPVTKKSSDEIFTVDSSTTTEFFILGLCDVTLHLRGGVEPCTCNSSLPGFSAKPRLCKHSSQEAWLSSGKKVSPSHQHNAMCDPGVRPNRPTTACNKESNLARTGNKQNRTKWCHTMRTLNMRRTEAICSSAGSVSTPRLVATSMASSVAHVSLSCPLGVETTDTGPIEGTSERAECRGSNFMVASTSPVPLTIPSNSAAASHRIAPNRKRSSSSSESIAAESH